MGEPPPQKFENSRKTSRSCPLNLWIPIWLQLSFWVAEVGFKLQGSPGWFHNRTGKLTGQILEAWLFHSPKLILHHLATFSRQLRLPSRNSGSEIFRTYASHRLEQVGPGVFGSNTWRITRVLVEFLSPQNVPYVSLLDGWRWKSDSNMQEQLKGRINTLVAFFAMFTLAADGLVGEVCQRHRAISHVFHGWLKLGH